jgi:hypothetical protein
MHSKSFICEGVPTWKTTFVYWPIECTLHLLGCSNFEKLPSSIDQLNAL